MARCRAVLLPGDLGRLVDSYRLDHDRGPPTIGEAIKRDPISSSLRLERAATYEAGDSECVVYFFGQGQGGSVDANLARWSSQFTSNGKPAPAKTMKKTVHGLKRVHVLYRRIDDDFLDPVVFRPDSQLGVAGLSATLRAGNAIVVNAIGTGIADDKAVYAFTPDMIRYYLGEQPLLPIVETFLLRNPEVREKVLRDLDKYVIKPTGASGGYGVVIGPRATDRQLAELRERQAHQVNSLETAVKLSSERYVAGRASYYEVLESQQQLFPTQLNLARTQRDQLLTVVALYKALGGGWQDETNSAALLSRN